MRYLILSDIHANYAALESVLADASGQYDRILNCGDLAGYGPDPNEVLEWCRKTPQLAVRGNHDKACAGLSDLAWFNPAARLSAVWTKSVLTPENRDFLSALPKGPVEADGFELFHGAPADEDEYLLDRTAAEYVRGDLTRGVAFFGHSHVQGGFILHRNGVLPISAGSITVSETEGYLINPGSVGQPRDHDPRAAYALYDEEHRVIEYRRTAYDIDRTYRRILEAGLPEVLGRRLYQGA